MPRKPAYAAKRSQDGEAPAASERADAWRASVNVRRRGMGNPEPTRAQRPAVTDSRKRSWIGCTDSGDFRIPSMARTQASAAGSVVMQGTP